MRTLNTRRRRCVLGAAAGALLWLLSAAAARPDADHGIYAALLARYDHAGVIDYAGIKHDESLLDEYLDTLAARDPEPLTRNEQFAYFINAYNAWTIKLILSGYPGVKSIKDLGSLLQSPWKKKFVRLKSGLVSLDHIEHDILRPRFKDPRVHFAINCASRGCPPLLAEPFTGDRLEEQLDFVARRFINDPAYNRLEGDTLYVSRIFKWFAEDFNHDVVGFFAAYAEGELKKGLTEKRSRIEIKHLDYDWSLNGK